MTQYKWQIKRNGSRESGKLKEVINTKVDEYASRQIKFMIIALACLVLLFIFLLSLMSHKSVAPNKINSVTVAQSSMDMAQAVAFQCGQVQMLMCWKKGKGCDIKTIEEYMAFSKDGGYK
jgi:ABC-type enterochelin transport system permease subunit